MKAPPLLFEWLEVLAVASARKVLKGPTVGVALFIALSSRGTSGEDATIDDLRLSAELGVSRRQVWRHVADLIDGGWLEQSAPPVRGRTGHPGSGRKARYRLTLPRLDLALHTGLDGVPETSAADV